MSGPTRRDLFKGVAALPLAAQIKGSAPAANAPRRPVVIASANGLETVKKAWSVLQAGGDPLDAVISGVNIVEDDPDDVTVGYGGIPNEEGVVQLDASVMDGRTMKAGAVGALEGKSPQEAGLKFLERIIAFAKDNRDKKGRPNYNINFYAVNKNGEHAGTSIWNGSYGRGDVLHPARFAVADSGGARLVDSAYLLKRERT